MVQHYIIRIDDVSNFEKSSKKKLWGINSEGDNAKWFIKSVKEGDILWFVKNKSKGQIVAMSEFTKLNKRILEPLVALSFKNKEPSWKILNDWDTEVYYKKLYDLRKCNLYTEIRGPCPIRIFDYKCKVNLLVEYENIVRYAETVKYMKMKKADKNNKCSPK